MNKLLTILIWAVLSASIYKAFGMIDDRLAEKYPDKEPLKIINLGGDTISVKTRGRTMDFYCDSVTVIDSGHISVCNGDTEMIIPVQAVVNQKLNK